MLSFLRYLLTRLREAAAAFWKAFSATESPRDPIYDEETRLCCLRTAIGLYKISFDRLPSQLEDLCFNNHCDPGWNGAFIPWRGPDTFRNLFGFYYRYSVADGCFTLLSPGLEIAQKHREDSAAAGEQ